MNSEYRNFNARLGLTTRSQESGDPVLEGYFVRYESPAPYCRGTDMMEKIKRGAFGTIEGSDIRCLYNHNTDQILGRLSNGTLTLEDRSDGLYGTVRINPNDSQAMDIYERVKRGDITGCSFGAYIDNETYDEDTNTWTLTRMELVEVSVCPFPFYDSTTMGARNAELERRERGKRFKELKFDLLKRRAKCRLKD